MLGLCLSRAQSTDRAKCYSPGLNSKPYSRRPHTLLTMTRCLPVLPPYFDAALCSKPILLFYSYVSLQQDGIHLSIERGSVTDMLIEYTSLAHQSEGNARRPLWPVG